MALLLCSIIAFTSPLSVKCETQWLDKDPPTFEAVILVDGTEHHLKANVEFGRLKITEIDGLCTHTSYIQHPALYPFPYEIHAPCAKRQWAARFMVQTPYSKDVFGPSYEGFVWNPLPTYRIYLDVDAVAEYPRFIATLTMLTQSLIIVLRSRNIQTEALETTSNILCYCLSGYFLRDLRSSDFNSDGSLTLIVPYDSWNVHCALFYSRIYVATSHAWRFTY